MVELKVASKEAVKLTFGGTHGFPLVENVLTSESVKGLQDSILEERARLASSQEHADGLATECAKLRTEVGDLREQLHEARGVRAQVGAPLFIIDDALANGLRQLVGIKPRPDWQSIETAPKDGTTVMVSRVTAGDGTRAIQLGRFDAGPGRWLTMDSDITDGAVCYMATMPSHWMPLPEPPR